MKQLDQQVPSAMKTHNEDLDRLLCVEERMRKMRDMSSRLGNKMWTTSLTGQADEFRVGVLYPETIEEQ